MIRGLVHRLLGDDTHSGHSLGEILGPDGAPKHTPESAATALLAHLSHPPDAADINAVVGALHALTLIEGTLGWLPGGTPTATQADSALHRLRCHAETLDLPFPASLPPGPDWRAWAWRASGSAVAHATLSGQPSRVWVSPSILQWDWAEYTLLNTPPEVRPPLQSARIDGIRFKAVQSDGQTSVTTEARKARLFISTTEIAAVNWTLGWPTSATSDGLQASHGERVLIGKLDPTWSWTVTDSGVQGRGDGPMRCSFELR